MSQTPQNPRYHAEGNVWNHTLMVLEEFHRLANREALSREDHEVLYWAALLHDIGKPRVTTWKNNRWVAHGHEKAGVSLARNILLQHPEISAFQRTRILDLVRWHHVPLRYGLQQVDLSAYKYIATRTDLRLLAIFGLMDTRGRICERKEEVVQLVSDFLYQIVPRIEGEMGTFDEIQTRFQQASPHTKNLLWVALQQRDFASIARYMGGGAPPESTLVPRCYLTIGAPRSGKTDYVKRHFAQCSYFNLSSMEPVVPAPEDPHPSFDLRALEDFLQRQFSQGLDVVVDGRNLQAAWREKIANLVRSFHAEVHYLFFDRSLDAILANNEREDHRLPEQEVTTAFDHLIMPHPWEAHALQLV